MIRELFNKGAVQKSLPIVSIVLGLILLIIGVFVHFENHFVQALFLKIGDSVLAGGVFAVILRSMQLMGVFKDELVTIIYEAAYLNNRKDLPDIWEKVSKVMFKNKFPGISKEITSDVKCIYFPIDHVLYYENFEQTINIELIDAANQLVKVTQYSQYTVFPKEKTNTFKHVSRNLLRFNKSKDEVSFNILKYKVNGTDFVPVVDEAINNNLLTTQYAISLSGKENEYSFETVIEKLYSLKYDNVIGHQKDYIIKNFNVKIHTKGNLAIDFYNMGTLKPFTNKTKVKDEHYMEYEYKGLIYPKQGYLITVKLK